LTKRLTIPVTPTMMAKIKKEAKRLGIRPVDLGRMALVLLLMEWDEMDRTREETRDV